MQHPRGIAKLVPGLILITLISAIANGQASGTPAAMPTGVPKIAIVNIHDAILSTDQAKKELDALQQRYAPRFAEIKKLDDELTVLRESTVKDAQNGTLSDDEKAARAKEFESKQKVLEREYDDTQSELQQAQQEMGTRIGAKLQTVLQKYAHDHGYWMVLDVSVQQNPVVWAIQGTDITADLVNAYDGKVVAAANATPPVTTTAGAAGTSGTAPKAFVSRAPSTIIPGTMIKNP